MMPPLLKAALARCLRTRMDIGWEESGLGVERPSWSTPLALAMRLASSSSSLHPAMGGQRVSGGPAVMRTGGRRAAASTQRGRDGLRGAGRPDMHGAAGGNLLTSRAAQQPPRPRRR
jgi:hypothetical protein